MSIYIPVLNYLNYIISHRKGEKSLRTGALARFLRGRKNEEFGFYVKNYLGKYCIFFLQKLQRPLY
jgi:hypothetical protein